MHSRTQICNENTNRTGDVMMIKDFAPDMPHYQPGESPTRDATLFNERLQEYHKGNTGEKVYNLGQGRENEDVGDDQWGPDEPTKITTAYNTQVGGGPEVRTIFADYINFMTGANVTWENCYAVTEEGRRGLVEAIAYGHSQSKDPHILLPDLGWPMVTDILEFLASDMEVVNYRNPVDEYDNGLSEVFAKANPAIVYVNSPHNPTGLVYGKKFAEGLMEDLERANADINPKTGKHTTLVLDNPYFHAAEMKSNPGAKGPVYDHGYKEMMDSKAKTPWVSIFSGSKAMGTASPGFFIVAVHPKISKAFQRLLVAFGEGTSYDPAYMRKVAAAFTQDKYPEHIKRFQRLRDKYEQNCASLAKHAGSDRVMPGSVGMTQLLKANDNLFGKRVEGKTGIYAIEKTTDILNFTGREGRVVMVEQSRQTNYKFQKAASADPVYQGYLRTAQALPVKDYDEGAEQLGNILRHIENSPSL